MTAPAEPPLIVPAADVARRAGLDQTDTDVLWTVEQAIRDAQVEAEGYLGRWVNLTEVTETGRVVTWDGSYNLSHDPVAEVVSATAELVDGYPTGRYTVVYRAGLDAATGPEYGPIRRWVAARARYDEGVRRLVAAARLREVKSVSASGQSVTYVDTPKSVDDMPTQSTMDRWRIAGRRVYTRAGVDPDGYYVHDHYDGCGCRY